MRTKHYIIDNGRKKHIEYVNEYVTDERGCINHEVYIIDEEGRKAYYHHAVTCRGYVSVKATIFDKMKPYKGRFGEGFVTYVHNDLSTSYCYKVYYIYE